LNSIVTEVRRISLLIALCVFVGSGPSGQQHVSPSKLVAHEGANKMDKNDVGLTCRAAVLEGKLAMSYTVSNRAGRDIFVLDAVPAVDEKSRSAYADLNSVFICWRPPATALLMRGITPLPSDKTVVVRVIPLGTKLPPGQHLERTFEVPLPVPERSIYYGPARPEQVEEIGINKVLLVVQFMRSTVDGFNAEPAPYAPDYYIVRGKHTIGQVESLECQSEIQQVKLLKRTDNFTRQ
jgi:hypothetical protein